MDSKDVWGRLLALGDVPDDEFDDDAAAALVHLLQQRGEAVVVEWALPTLTDPDPWRRQAAAWVLGQHGFECGRPFADRVLPALASAARSERDEDTRETLVVALGHADDPDWVPELLRYVEDDYPPVRQCVAGALPIMFAGADMSAEAIAALITLTGDTDPDVRDWATFSLGNQSHADSATIRDALAARLDDEDRDTRFEATVGLARRGDPRALAEVMRRFHDDTVTTTYLLDLEAAAELADPVLLPVLEQLRIRWAGDDDSHTVAVRYAIDRCQPAAHDLARTLEAELTAAVNHTLRDIEWTITCSGSYPLTVLTIHRPDGTLCTSHDHTTLWDDISPTEFNAAQEVASWSMTIREIAKAQTP